MSFGDRESDWTASGSS